MYKCFHSCPIYKCFHSCPIYKFFHIQDASCIDTYCIWKTLSHIHNIYIACSWHFFTQSRCALSERAARFFETNSARWYVCCTQSVWSMCSSGWIRKRQLAAQFTIPHDHRARFWEIIPQLAAPIASAAQSVWSSFFSVSTPQYLYGLLLMLFTHIYIYIYIYRCSYRACCSQVLSSKSACWYVYYTQ